MRRRPLTVSAIGIAITGVILLRFGAGVPSAAEPSTDLTLISDSSVCTTLETSPKVATETLLTLFIDKGLPAPCTSKIPFEDPNFPDSASLLDRIQHQFDRYSWLTFVALNSPADGSRFGANVPTRWESWKELEDVMLPRKDLTLESKTPSDKQDPWFRDFVAPHRIPDECRLSSLSPPPLVVHMEEETFDQPFRSGPLVDQNGRFALNVILMNEEMFTYIRDNGLNSREGQGLFTHNEKVIFPVGLGKHDTISAVPTPAIGTMKVKGPALGAMMVKASWKELTDGDDARTFHTINALVYAPQEKDHVKRCRVMQLGLVGLHIVHKTFDRNQWIWTTFEHVDNAPTLDKTPDGKAAQGGLYHFFRPPVVGPGPQANEPPPMAWDISEPPKDFHSQIVRMRPLTPDVVNMNETAQGLPGIKDTVWKNYELISTQWPSDVDCAKDLVADNESDPTCAPAPTFLANTTLETYSQEDRRTGGVGQATSSCIGCHNNAATHHVPATQSDFTYILEKAK
jgi:hypothetical protein